MRITQKPDRKSTDARLDEDIDALFKLPLAEFTDARNSLATGLKKTGRVDEAGSVKALSKPSISAWAVNQLYWNQREAFDQLIESGERFHKAQSSGKVAQIREVIEARREALTDLSDLAASLLRDAGHNPAPDTIHRITTTLEALSVYASRSDSPHAGRLTGDVDPPGFESFGSWTPTADKTFTAKQPAKQSSGTIPAPKSTVASKKASPRHDEARVEEKRKAKISAAKGVMQEAKKSLTAARARAQRLEAAQKKAASDVRTAEKLRQVAELSLSRARAAADHAVERAQSIASEIEESTSAVEEAERVFEQASEELEKLIG